MQQPIELVVVDYLQLITGTERWTREDPVNWTKQVSQSLKQLARELSVPVIALAQLNRNLENRPKKEPVLSDLKESGAIEQDADIVLMMYREEYYFEETDRIGLADVFVRKNRDGATGDVELRWHPERMTFSDSK
jgi:replicative DNA helicase